MSLQRVLETKRVVISCGSGGVGKTTLAAAMALQLAMAGKRVAVLTIDPAKRLANALGLKTLSDEPKEVLLSPRGVKTGSLAAMVLDTKRTFDRIIEKYSPSAETREAILKNRLYQHVSSMLAGSQEYMAMEKLWEIYESGNYDLIILDTPPTRHALDFLEAPKKMVDVTSHSLLKWFLNPTFLTGKAPAFLQKGLDKILAVFDQVAGFSFLHELSQMLLSIAGLLGGFKNRAAKVYNLLRSNHVAFLCVTSPHPLAIQDALSFYKDMKAMKFPFTGFLINRVRPSYVSDSSDWHAIEKAARPGPFLDNLKNLQLLHNRDEEAIAVLEEEGGTRPFYHRIPDLNREIHNLNTLSQLLT